MQAIPLPASLLLAITLNIPGGKSLIHTPVAATASATTTIITVIAALATSEKAGCIMTHYAQGYKHRSGAADTVILGHLRTETYLCIEFDVFGTEFKFTKGSTKGKSAFSTFTSPAI